MDWAGGATVSLGASEVWGVGGEGGLGGGGTVSLGASEVWGVGGEGGLGGVVVVVVVGGVTLSLGLPGCRIVADHHWLAPSDPDL